MSQVFSFPPVADAKARVLILGSMPGRRSLELNQYYAHKQNSFWRIIGDIAGFDPKLDYEGKLSGMQQAGIALWDVLHSCVRPGSADSAIEQGTRVPNDFAGLFNECPGIRLVCFNGGEAEKSYQRYVLPWLDDDRRRYVRLPSTSPAYAVMSFEQKLARWREALEKR